MKTGRKKVADSGAPTKKMWTNDNFLEKLMHKGERKHRNRDGKAGKQVSGSEGVEVPWEQEPR